ncbi:uncharacterized protein A4U43_C04F32240 [Asparagus officinalis]|uniref:BP28 C-terminal domain-containing protein n=1 Tax=Asparagus officinalis TaxID=4686 RepID=A0A5P1F549_ASPOF|nr:uncharacterized protein A4U43_C04F32240 [Asparagus officinalis]
MATSLASQLRAIKSIHKGTPDPIRRPLTRPSILFDPKEAADIDLRSILSIALSGLEALIELDARIHAFNTEELVLCTLPYHDTHMFVRVVQLLDLGDKKWAFLEGVKTSGAPPPRKVIVQQCIRDKGILEILCDYAKPSSEFQHARPVICFCTAVIVEALGSIPKLDTDTVQRVLPFVSNGLNPDMKGSRDHKAGALMVVGLLATRSMLAPKLIQSLVFNISRVAQHDAKQSADLPWIRVTIMAIVTLVQSQSTQVFSKKTMMVLKEIRDLAGVLSGLSQEFNIQKFLCLYLETLVDYSSSDASYLHGLINMLETLQIKEIIDKVVSKILAHCMRFLHNKDTSNLHEKGEWAKKLLVVIDKHYSSELREAVQKFLESSKMNLKEGDSNFRSLCQMFDEGLEMPSDTCDSKFWFSLEHPKAEIRLAALSGIAASGILNDMSANPEKLLNAQNAIVRRLHDDDLTVVQAALSVGLAGIVNPSCLLRSYRDVFFRCIDIINRSTSATSLAIDVAILCLEHMVLDVPMDHLDYSKEVASIIFPLLLVLPKTWRLNLKALELAKQLRWPFYDDSNIDLDPTSSEKGKILESGYITNVNFKTTEALAETFRKNPDVHIEWLVECRRCSEQARSLFLLIILQASVIHNEDSCSVLKLYRACSASLRENWHQMEPHGRIGSSEEFSLDKFEKSCLGLVDQLLSTDVETLNIKIHICIYWCVLKACSESVKRSASADHCEQLTMLNEMFLFFTTSPSKNIFRKHIHFLVKNCSSSPFQFLCKYFTEGGFPVGVQVESLCLLSTLSSMYGSLERSNINEDGYLEFLLGFPSLLVPLSNTNKDVRTAAANCIAGIYELWRQFDVSRLKNGSDTILSRCLLTPTFGEFLESIVSQTELISSDADFLPSFFTSMLSTSGHSLMVSEDINKRFDQASKDAILLFILSSALKFSSYGKLVVLSLFQGLGSSILHFEGVRILLFELLERRDKEHLRTGQSGQVLSQIEVETLCLLLVICVHPSNSVCVERDIFDCLIKALQVDSSSSDKSVVVQPCITVLQNITCSFYDGLEAEMQDDLFGNLVFLFRNDNVDIRNAATEAVLLINISCSTIVRLFALLLGPDQQNGSSKRVKRERAVTWRRMSLDENLLDREETTLYLIGSLLDILLLKKHIEKRDSLVQPLFRVLEKLFSKKWLLGLVSQVDKGSGSLSDVSESISGGIYYAQQTVLSILKDITDTYLVEHPHKDEFSNAFKIDLLVECARSTENVSTRNHVFLLLSSIAKASPGWLSKYMFEIFTIIGESTVKQIDSHSQHTMEDLISKLVPCWLSETSSIDKLLQIFIKALPDVPEHRRLTLIVYLLRSLGEKDSLGVLTYHLFHSVISRASNPSDGEGNKHAILSSSTFLSEWEYVFAVQLSGQYSCDIWFSCLVILLQEIKMHSEREEFFSILHMAMQFIVEKLEDAELFFQLESGQHPGHLQVKLGLLMEEVVCHLQLMNVKRKQVSLSRDAMKELKDCSNSVLKKITILMSPSSYFKSITQLLENSDGNIKKKALGLLCENIKDQSFVQRKCKDKRRTKQKFAIHLDEIAITSFNELCLKIVHLISYTVDESETPVKLAAISALEVLSKEVPSDNLKFSTCLACVVNYIRSPDLAISSACLRSIGSLVNVLGSKALSHLPEIMKLMLEKAHEITCCPIRNSKYSDLWSANGVSNQKVPLLLSIAITLEAVIENLGGFLNPYLEDILDLILLHPEYAQDSDAKLNSKAATVRKLLTEKIPVRLMLTPLLKMYSSALKCGESSLCLVFEMLASIIGVMDRPSIGTYHVKIFEQCLIALDIRCHLPESIKNVNIVEQSVTDAVLVLTMKLTETMFRPLFMHSLDWADSKLEGSESISFDRKITFYKLVNKLLEKHRSLFVPYFKYLLEDCTRHLTEDQDIGLIPLTQKKKKAKHGNASSVAKPKDVLSHKQWHLRALVLKSLYQCFLYDTTDLKFLDASNFEVLLKPIVSQIVVDPPSSADVLLDMPTVDEVDETLVLCLGQMAVTAHSDVLWKPLNHEVLMQTRSEKTRPKILGLKVVKYLVEHLKEEYLIFLPETIPFLGELLEDVELPVKTLAQEILKEMETLSGENLQQYL